MRTISAFIRQRGFATHLIFYKASAFYERDVPTQREEDLLLGLLKDLRPDIVGIYVIAPFFRAAASLTERIKKELVTVVVWGGSHPTIQPEESINHADILCRGEGELPFADLVEMMANGQAVDCIQNLWVKTDGRVTRNGIRPLLQREGLDALPFPDSGGTNKYLIENERLVQADPLNKTIDYFSFASRGCPFRCNFCINGVLSEVYHGAGPYVRVKSPEYVVSEIAHMLEIFPAVRRIRFEDEIFPWKLEWVEKFCGEYSKRIGLPFLFASHATVVSENAIRLLKAAGLMVVGFGVQSPCLRVRRDVLNRPETNEAILNCIGILQRNKVECFFDVILDNPFETDEDKTDGFRFLLSIPRPYVMTPFSLKYLPGHRLTDEALRKHLIDASQVVTASPQRWFRLSYDLKSKRRPEDIFWNCLYMLSPRSILPVALLRILGNSAFLKKHPSPLELLTKFTWPLELFVIAFRRLAHGQLKLTNTLRVALSKVLRRHI